jgi:ribosomal protein S18 acetylase RimI-like enzyme
MAHFVVEPANGAAMRLYRRVGFKDNGRQLMTLRLDAPLHIEWPTS